MQATIRINLNEFENGINQAQKKFKSFSDNIKGISDGISKAYSGVGDALKPAIDGFKAVEDVGKKAGSAITSGIKGFAAASTAVAGFGVAAVKSGMSFDATMSKVSAISGATGDDFQALRDKAIDMGEQTKFSAAEAAEAMTYMGMAGWKTHDMLDGIAGIMNLAAASGEDLATTSDIVTDALTAFGMQASDSERLANLLAAASTNANTDVGMMGETFKYVAPVAGALGYSAADSALAIGLMANSSIKASQAGTSLRSLMTRMAKPTKESGAAMQALGISLTDSQGRMLSFGEVIDDLRTGFSGLTESEKARYAAMLAGQEAMSGLLAIVNASEEDVNKLSDAIMLSNAVYVKTTDGAIIPMTQALKEGKEWVEEYEGAAARMAATMMDNLAGDVTYWQSAFGTLQIVISDSLKELAREFVQFGTKSVKSLTEGFREGGVTGFMSALTNIVTDGVTMLASKAPEFAGVSLQFIRSFADGILGARTEIADAVINISYMLTNGIGSWLSSNSGELIAAGNQIIAIIFSGFLRAGSLIRDNIGQFIPLIARAFFDYHDAIFTIGMDILGAIGQGIVENKNAIQGTISTVIDEMVWAIHENAPMIIEGGIALLEALASAIVENLPLIAATGAEIIGRLVEGIATASPAVQAIIGTAVLPHILKIIEVVGGIGSAVGGVVKLVGDGIGTIMGIGSKLMGGIQALWGLITAHPVVAVVTAIIAAVMLLWNNCEAFRDAVKDIWDAIVGFFQAAADLIKAAFDGVVDFFKGIWDGIQSIFSVVADVLGGFFSAAAEAVKTAWEAVSAFFSGVWEAIQGVFSSVAEVLGGFFSAAANAVRTAWNAVSEFFGGIADGIRSAFETATQFLGEAFSAAWQAVSNAWGAAKEFFSGIWETISSLFGGAAEWFGGIFSAAWTAITSAWGGAIDFFSGIWEEIKGVFGDVWEKFLEIGGNIVNGIKEGITGAWNAFTGWLSEKVGSIVDIAKNLLGIHSPSTVFAEIGENIMLGMSGGMDSKMDVVNDAAQSLAAVAKSGVEGLSNDYSLAGEEAMIGLQASIKAKNEAVLAATMYVTNQAAQSMASLSAQFSSIGDNAMSSLENSMSSGIGKLQSKVKSLMDGIAAAAKAALGIHSPSKVFASIGENMALGLGEGWNAEYSAIKAKIENGMNFNAGIATIGIATNGGYGGAAYGQGNLQERASAGATTNFNFTFNSPAAMDPVTAAKEAKKAAQQMAMQYA